MKNALIILVIIVLLVLGAVYFKSYLTPEYSENMMPPPATDRADDTTSINAELEDVDLGDLDAEFEAIDSDMNSL